MKAFQGLERITEFCLITFSLGTEKINLSINYHCFYLGKATKYLYKLFHVTHFRH